MLQGEATAGYELPHTEAKNLQLLQQAAKSENIELLTDCLRYGARINAVDMDGNSALMIASSLGNVEMVRCLCQYGADVNLRAVDGSTAVLKAVRLGHLLVVNLLCQYRADLNLSNNRDKTPLSCAVRRGHSEMVKTLCVGGAKVNHQNRTGMTALHLGALMGHAESVIVLLKAGASLAIKNREGHTPKMLAKSSGHKEVADILKNFQGRGRRFSFWGMFKNKHPYLNLNVPDPRYSNLGNWSNGAAWHVSGVPSSGNLAASAEPYYEFIDDVQRRQIDRNTQPKSSICDTDGAHALSASVVYVNPSSLVELPAPRLSQVRVEEGLQPGADLGVSAENCQPSSLDLLPSPPPPRPNRPLPSPPTLHQTSPPRRRQMTTKPTPRPRTKPIPTPRSKKTAYVSPFAIQNPPQLEVRGLARPSSSRSVLQNEIYAEPIEDDEPDAEDENGDDSSETVPDEEIQRMFERHLTLSEQPASSREDQTRVKQPVFTHIESTQSHNTLEDHTYVKQPVFTHTESTQSHNTLEDQTYVKQPVFTHTDSTQSHNTLEDQTYVKQPVFTHTESTKSHNTLEEQTHVKQSCDTQGNQVFIKPRSPIKLDDHRQQRVCVARPLNPTDAETQTFVQLTARQEPSPRHRDKVEVLNTECPFSVTQFPALPPRMPFTDCGRNVQHGRQEHNQSPYVRETQTVQFPTDPPPLLPQRPPVQDDELDRIIREFNLEILPLSSGELKPSDEFLPVSVAAPYPTAMGDDRCDQNLQRNISGLQDQTHQAATAASPYQNHLGQPCCESFTMVKPVCHVMQASEPCQCQISQIRTGGQPLSKIKICSHSQADNHKVQAQPQPTATPPALSATHNVCSPHRGHVHQAEQDDNGKESAEEKKRNNNAGNDTDDDVGSDFEIIDRFEL